MSTKTVCYHCHYSFDLQRSAFCKCRLCLDPDNHNVQAFARKMMAFGFNQGLQHAGHEQMKPLAALEHIDFQIENLKSDIEDIMGDKS